MVIFVWSTERENKKYQANVRFFTCHASGRHFYQKQWHSRYSLSVLAFHGNQTYDLGINSYRNYRKYMEKFLWDIFNFRFQKIDEYTPVHLSIHRQMHSGQNSWIHYTPLEDALLLICFYSLTVWCVFLSTREHCKLSKFIPEPFIHLNTSQKSKYQTIQVKYMPTQDH